MFVCIIIVAQTHTHKIDAATLINVYISLNVSGK